jgi:hypothetical protein
MEIFVEELEIERDYNIISSRESRNVIVVQVEVRGDAFVSDSGFGLTVLVTVVVVEMQGEISHKWEIWWRSQWGECYGVPGSSGMAM